MDTAEGKDIKRRKAVYERQERMKRVAIFGAGQAGAMVKTWLPAEMEPVCFIDNQIEKQGQAMEGCRVLSLEDALALKPELVVLAILNQEATQAVQAQLRTSGFQGSCIGLETIRALQDVRLSALRLQAREIEARGISGDVAELGVYQGAFAAEINCLFPERRLWLFDTFEGFPACDLATEAEQTGEVKKHRSFSDTTVEKVRRRLPHPDKAEFVKGYFPESLREVKAADTLRFALVSLDPDLYAPTLAGLRYFYPRLVPGGRILIHDYTSCQFEGVKRAVDAYCRAQGLFVVPLMDLHGTAILIKSREG